MLSYGEIVGFFRKFVR